jgi:hypothetical protein
MPNHPDHLNEPEPGRGGGRLLAGFAILAVLVLVIALHLTGVVGARSH